MGLCPPFWEGPTVKEKEKETPAFLESRSATASSTNEESTFFILNIDYFFVQNWVLVYMNENAKRSAESILMLYIHFPLSFLIHLVQVKQIVKVQYISTHQTLIKVSSRVKNHLFSKFSIFR